MILIAAKAQGKNRKLMQCSVNTKQFIFFAPGLARVQIS